MPLIIIMEPQQELSPDGMAVRIRTTPPITTFVSPKERVSGR